MKLTPQQALEKIKAFKKDPETARFAQTELLLITMQQIVSAIESMGNRPLSIEGVDVTEIQGKKGDDGADADPIAVAKALKNDPSFLALVKGEQGEPGAPAEIPSLGELASFVIDILKEDTDFTDALRGEDGEDAVFDINELIATIKGSIDIIDAKQVIDTINSTNESIEPSAIKGWASLLQSIKDIALAVDKKGRAIVGAAARTFLAVNGTDKGLAPYIDIREGSGISVQHSFVGKFHRLIISVTGLGGGGVSDHGALTGLSDDDHPQYHNDARGDARYSQLGHTHTAAQVTDFDTEVGNHPDVAANTGARHSHANAAILNATTAPFTTADENKLDNISVTQPVDLDAIETRVNALDAAVILMGTWDASAGTFPGSGAAQAGHAYIVSVAGTVDGVAFNVGDRVIAITDNASSTIFASNWFLEDYTDKVLSVNGFTGAVTLTSSNIAEGSNLYFTNARAIAAVLTGFAVGTRTAIVAADSILAAFGKAQKYFNDLSALAFSGNASDLAGTKTSAFITDFTSAVTSLVTSVGGGLFSALGHSHSGLIPTGGTTGQVLKKQSNTDYDVAWGPDNTGSGGSLPGAANEILVSDGAGGATTFPGVEADSGGITTPALVAGSVAAEIVEAGITDTFSLSTAVNTITTNTTLGYTHFSALVDTTSGSITISLPPAAGTLIPGMIYVIKKIDSSANTVIIDADASETIDGATTYTLSAQYEFVCVQSDGANWVILGKTATGGTYTDEQAQDAVGATLVASDTVTPTYNDATPSMKFDVYEAIIFDHFLYGRTALSADGQFGPYFWYDEVSAGTLTPISVAGRAGVVRMAIATAAASVTNWLGFNGVQFTERSFDPVYEVVLLGDANTDHRIIAGFHQIAAATTISADTNNSANEAFFRKKAGNNYYEAVTRAGSGTETVTAITGATASSWRTLRIEMDDAGAEVRFYVDGALEATHADASVPATGTRLTAAVGHGVTGTTNRSIDIDLIKIRS